MSAGARALQRPAVEQVGVSAAQQAQDSLFADAVGRALLVVPGLPAGARGLVRPPPVVVAEPRRPDGPARAVAGHDRPQEARAAPSPRADLRREPRRGRALVLVGEQVSVGVIKQCHPSHTQIKVPQVVVSLGVLRAPLSEPAADTDLAVLKGRPPLRTATVVLSIKVSRRLRPAQVQEPGSTPVGQCP